MFSKEPREVRAMERSATDAHYIQLIEATRPAIAEERNGGHLFGANHEAAHYVRGILTTLNSLSWHAAELAPERDGMTDQEIFAAVQRVEERFDEAFDEDADKWQADKHLALEDLETQLDELIARINPEK